MILAAGARAIREAEDADGDLANAVLALLNERAGCAAAAPFDAHARRLPTMVSVEARL
ncbi:MAG TPA: hypothetical protein VHA07_00800 [Devosia sp.]|nr:hypothetical protein [Devosia sp.]